MKIECGKTYKTVGGFKAKIIHYQGYSDQYWAAVWMTWSGCATPSNGRYDDVEVIVKYSREGNLDFISWNGLQAIERHSLLLGTNKHPADLTEDEL